MGRVNSSHLIADVKKVFWRRRNNLFGPEDMMSEPTLVNILTCKDHIIVGKFSEFTANVIKNKRYENYPHTYTFFVNFTFTYFCLAFGSFNMI